MSRTRATFRPMTPLEKARALALGWCSFPPATFSKRFARTMAAQARGEALITEAQAVRLEVQCYIYRRQVPAMARELVVSGQLQEIPPGIVPDTPPPGYATPKQRELSYRMEMERRRALPQCQETAKKSTTSHTEDLFPNN